MDYLVNASEEEYKRFKFFGKIRYDFDLDFLDFEEIDKIKENNK